MKGPIRLQLRVSPGAPRAQVVGRHGAAWKVRVAAAPENGRANEAVIRLLAETLDLSRSEIEIVAGQSTRDKVVSLTGVDSDELDRLLESASERPRGEAA